MLATKVKAAAVETANEVSQLQSQQVVQTLLHSSISELLHMRSVLASPEPYKKTTAYSIDSLLLSDSSFANIKYPLKAEVDYEAFASGKQTGGTGQFSTNIHLILRGHSPDGDVLLDWLQKGAFEALRKRWLRALQLNVYADNVNKKGPRRVVESYTFTFTYAELGDAADVTFTSSQGDEISLKSIRYALHQFLRQLVNICQTLPQLPDRRYLSMNLFYTDDCPDGWQPLDFEESDQPDLHFAHASGWTPKAVQVGHVDTGYHTSSLTVAHLNHEEVQTDELLDRAMVIPARLPRTLKRPADIDIVGPVTRSKVAKNTTFPKPKSAVSSRSGTTQARQVQCQKQTTRAPIVDDDDEGPSQQSTQTRRDVQIQKELVNLMKPPQISGSLAETQQIARNSQENTEPSQPTRDMAPLMYSQAKLRELNARPVSPPGIRKHREESTSTMDVDEDEQVVDCQCGVNLDEGSLLCCDFCAKWQHVQCYGYQSRDDSRIPPKHACYLCLLDKQEKSLFEDLEELAFLRRIVSLIKREGGTSGMKALAEDLPCASSAAKDAFDHLRRRKWLVDAPGSRSRGFKDTGRLAYIITKDSGAYDEMARELFDPTTHIKQHLVPSVQPMSSSLLTQVTQAPGFISSVTAGLQKQDWPSSITNASQQLNLDESPIRTKSLRSRQGPRTAEAIIEETVSIGRNSQHATRSAQAKKATNAPPTAIIVESDSDLSPCPDTPPKRAPGKKPSAAKKTATPKSKAKRLRMSKSCGELDVSHRSPTQASAAGDEEL